MVGRRKAADSRGEFFGSAAGIGDGASAWDFHQLLFAWRKRIAKVGLGCNRGLGVRAWTAGPQHQDLLNVLDAIGKAGGGVRSLVDA